jgi:hypothetical protein
MIALKTQLCISAILLSSLFCSSQTIVNSDDSIPYDIYPMVIDYLPELPSPLTTSKGEEYVVAVTSENKYAIIPVTLSNDRGICPQLIVDTSDFPQLGQTGLHSEETLNNIQTITGRSLQEITELGRPNGLSQAGFLAQDENILSVIKGDNRLVNHLDLTHPQLAKPIFHVLNMMDTDLSLSRWNHAKHRWENIRYFYYNSHKVFVEAEDTKGGQKSIFDDHMEGAFYIKLWRELDKDELQYLKDRYGSLPEDEFNDFKNRLSRINTGEMQPQYIMRYGFYEGHTFWRTDPIALSFIFGLRSLEELDRLFENNLPTVLTQHYTQ